MSILEGNRWLISHVGGSLLDRFARTVLEADDHKVVLEQHRFGGLDLTIRQPIYIPRVETEQWVLLLAKHILDHSPENKPIRILDICSGSGCIPLLLALEGKGRIRTVGLDVDDIALQVARENARRNGIDHLSTFEKLDLFSEEDVERVRQSLGGSFDLVVSNPPYVSSKDMKQVEGKWHEGKYALQGKLKVKARAREANETSADEEDDDEDDDGYSFYRRILEIYHPFLSPHRPSHIPKLVLEIGATQSRPVQTMYEGQGRMVVYKETERRRDLSAPKLEHGNMVGTERSLWIYENGE
jgi:methylase of polypeptide subunit release factors